MNNLINEENEIFDQKIAKAYREALEEVWHGATSFSMALSKRGVDNSLPFLPMGKYSDKYLSVAAYLRNHRKNNPNGWVLLNDKFFGGQLTDDECLAQLKLHNKLPKFSTEGCINYLVTQGYHVANYEFSADSKEQECIDYLKSLGKYKIMRNEWVEL